MFKIKSLENVFNFFELRKRLVKNTDKIPINDKIYLEYITKYKGIEIIPDIQLFGYEVALQENTYVEDNYPTISSEVWMFARSGQGDEWFLSKLTFNVLFYDHNQGEYSSLNEFVDFSINFSKFLQISFLYRELEEQLDKHNDSLSIEYQNQFTTSLSELNSDFYDKFPNKYF